MNIIIPKKTDSKKAYLNIGCGGHFWADWNNLDLIKHPDVIQFDIRKRLPFPNDSIDYVYSSHVLEHMTREEAIELLREIERVIKKDGIVRIVVPDLEKICKEYIQNLNKVQNNPSVENTEKYEWIVLELLDQMTRKKSGGYMREFLNNKKNNIREYMIDRVGDNAIEKPNINSIKTNIYLSMKKWLQNSIHRLIPKNNPDKTGELHRWMYDSFSIKNILQKNGFNDIQIKKFDESNLLNWTKYNLDKSIIFPNKARKPDSLFIEAKK